jgi:hypothetical protein
LTPFFNKTIKDTAYIIKKHKSFFDSSSLNQFDKIIIIGHSLSEIDLPYFEKIANNATNVNNCIITYHGEKELRDVRSKSFKIRGKKVFINLKYEALGNS